MQRASRVFRFVRGAVVAAAFASAGQAGAACNEPPAAPPLWRGPGVGAIDSPFLIAGKKRTVTAAGIVDTDTVAIGYLPPPGSNSTGALVILKENCAGWTAPACPGVAVACEKSDLSFGQPQSPHVHFTVPKFVQKTAGKDVERVGPVRVAVTTTAAPCWVADPASTCPGTANATTHACVDTLDPPACTDPACVPPACQPSGCVPARNRLESVTALPAANDFQQICDPSGGSGGHQCKGTGHKLELTVAANGDLLVPMDWGKLLRKGSGADADCDEALEKCDTREIVAATTLPAWPAPSTDPIAIDATDLAAVQSFNAYGQVFDEPPLFSVDTGVPSGEFGLKGDTDKKFSVLRLRRCESGASSCQDDDAYFKLGPRAVDGGPVVIGKHGKKGGTCSTTTTQQCSPSQPCPTGEVCVWVGGEAKGFKNPRHDDGSSVPPPGSAGGGGLNTTVLVIVVFLALAVTIFMAKGPGN